MSRRPPRALVALVVSLTAPPAALAADLVVDASTSPWTSALSVPAGDTLTVLPDGVIDVPSGFQAVSVDGGILVSSGTVVNRSGQSAVSVGEGGRATITGGSVEVYSAFNGASGAVRVDWGGELVVTGGTFLQDSGGPGVVTTFGGVVTLDGGHFQAVNRVGQGGGVSAYDGALVTVNGGTFDALDGVVAFGSTVTLNGGVFHAGQQTVRGVGSTLVVTGGEYSSARPSSCLRIDDGTLDVSGGTFTSCDLVALCDQADAEVVIHALELESTRTVRAHPGEPRVGGTILGTLLDGSHIAMDYLLGSEEYLSCSATLRFVSETCDDPDGDGVCAPDDVCPGEDDLIDTDGDGLCGAADPCPDDPTNDAGGDGRCSDLVIDASNSPFAGPYFAASGDTITVMPDGTAVGSAPGFVLSVGYGGRLWSAGTIVSQGGSTALEVDIDGSATIDGGYYVVEHAANGAHGVVRVRENGDLHVLDGTFVEDSGGTGVVRSDGGRVTIDGGTFTAVDRVGQGMALDARDGSDVTVRGGTFSGVEGIWLERSTMRVEGGSFTARQETIRIADAALTITGGTFVASDPSRCSRIEGGSTVEISGGDFAACNLGAMCEARPMAATPDTVVTVRGQHFASTRSVVVHSGPDSSATGRIVGTLEDGTPIDTLFGLWAPEREDCSVTLRFEAADCDDPDGDGVCAPDDVCPGEDDLADEDGDGLCGASDPCPLDPGNDEDGDGQCLPWDDCPLDPANDADHDGLCADEDPCPLDFPDDRDGDGACDSDDPCPYDARDDGDGDGSCDSEDRCPADPADDADGDGRCADEDPCPLDPENDLDGDGRCGDVDPCPYDALDDRDGDGLCESADLCPEDPTNDVDGDHLCADVDPCPTEDTNDPDGDGACEGADPCPYDALDDRDGDGQCESADRCPADPLDDADGDGLCADVDPCPESGWDGDGDGVSDGCDVCPADAANDHDGDGSCDSEDVCPDDPADDADGDSLCADQEAPGCELDPENDADGDAVCVPDDICPYDPDNDADGDGLCADVDPCPQSAGDADADGLGDACDPCPLDEGNDADGDGACGDVDPCPSDPADDGDGDGACDTDDPCPRDPLDDADGDGACGDVDPCPSDAANDADGDGVCEGADNCDAVANPDQADADHDGTGDACEASDPGTPPGQGGTPPGQGGTPPGLGGSPPGHGGPRPGRGR